MMFIEFPLDPSFSARFKARRVGLANRGSQLSTQLQPLFLGRERPWQIAACQCAAMWAPLHSIGCISICAIDNIAFYLWFVMAHGHRTHNGNPIMAHNPTFGHTFGHMPPPESTLVVYVVCDNCEQDASHTETVHERHLTTSFTNSVLAQAPSTPDIWKPDNSSGIPPHNRFPVSYSHQTVC